MTTADIKTLMNKTNLKESFTPTPQCISGTPHHELTLWEKLSYRFYD
jgi:hypothetical protein